MPALQCSRDLGPVLQQRFRCRGIHLVTLQRCPARTDAHDRQGDPGHPPGVRSLPAIRVQQAKEEEAEGAHPVQMARDGRSGRGPDGGQQQPAGLRWWWWRRSPLGHAARPPDVPSQARPRRVRLHGPAEAGRRRSSVRPQSGGMVRDGPASPAGWLRSVPTRGLIILIHRFYILLL